MSRIRIFTITSQDYNYIDARNILGVLKCTLVIHTHYNCVLTLTSNFEPETFGGATAIHSQVPLCLQPCHLCFTTKKYTSSHGYNFFYWSMHAQWEICYLFLKWEPNFILLSPCASRNHHEILRIFFFLILLSRQAEQD